MNKITAFLFAGAILTCSFADQSTTNAQPTDDVARKTKVQEMLRKRTGGIVRKAGSGRGSIVVVNAQSKVDRSALEIPVTFIEKRLHLYAKCVDGTLDGFPTKEAVTKTGGTVAIYVVDRENFPSPMLVAPESRWALVNVWALATDGAAGEKLAKRTTTEVGRAVGYLCGSCNSQYPGTTMSAMRSVQSLDVFNGNGEVPLDQFSKIVDYMRGLGASQFIEATYLKACKEGWAPDPQDEYQMAIYNEVRALPEKPIKIEFDPAKGK